MATPMRATQAPLRTFRPRDLAADYTQPNVQLRRLARQGRVRRVGHGFYIAVPDDQGPDWVPTLEAAAAGIATALFGERVPVLMHLSAARLLGAAPRALGQAFVAAPRQHAAIPLDTPPGGTVTFVKRDVDALDAVLLPTELGMVLATTVEQTVLDLARRPALGGAPGDAWEAIRGLLPRCDLDHLRRLGREQRGGRALARVLGDER